MGILAQGGCGPRDDEVAHGSQGEEEERMRRRPRNGIFTSALGRKQKAARLFPLRIRTDGLPSGG